MRWTLPPACALALLASALHADTATTAKEILDASGFHGGLIVMTGCPDGGLAAMLRTGESTLVQAMETDLTRVATAREKVRAAGCYGPVSVDRFDGKHLPYADNLVNLVVSEDLGSVTREEAMRVLAPGGKLCLREGADWKVNPKPRPGNIDEWTHFLYDPSNNAVSRDEVVGPPKSMQWVAEPRWARSHEHLATVSAVVTGGGRIFTIVDEAPPASVLLPSRWSLVARDAFNGVLLWKREIPNWEGQLRPFRSGPHDLPRRVVVDGDTVYATLGYGAPVTALDAASGKTLKTYSGTEGTAEILCTGDTLYLLAGDIDPKEYQETSSLMQPSPALRNKRILAVDTTEGNIRWKLADEDTAHAMPLNLAVAGDRLLFQSTTQLICVDAKSGKEAWRSERPVAVSRMAWSAPTMVVYKDVVISADQAPVPSAKLEKLDTEGREVSVRPDGKVDWVVTNMGGGQRGEMIAFSLKNGRQLWSAPCEETYNAPPDVMVANGLVWSGELVMAKEPGITRALDPFTGEVKQTRSPDSEFFTPGMGHHRCYRNKATERFLMLGRSGVECIDVQTGNATADHWIRGTCQQGVTPANGLLYVPPHSCACYITSKLNSFNALAPTRQPTRATGEPLERGPAFEKIDHLPSAIENRADWPTYRRDPSRSGAADDPLPAKLKRAWQAKLGGRLSSLTVAEGKIFVAQIDAHTLHALDASNGKPIWHFTAGGRIDSPPTIYGGRVLVGSADGKVYCLRASDGAMAWSFRAGPEDRRVVAYGQVESAWPVHGSILVQDGAAYFAAGRSAFLDDGILLYKLDPATGKVLAQHRLDRRDPATGTEPKDIVQGTSMPGSLPDVLSSDGQLVYMRDLQIDPATLKPTEKTGTHLWSPTGFLDDSWWHRSYWIYGSQFFHGWGGWWKAGNQTQAGRLLAFDEDRLFGFGRNFYPSRNAGQWNKGENYRVFGTSRELQTIAGAAVAAAAPPAAKADGKKRAKQKGGTDPAMDRSLVKVDWEQQAPIEARAILLAGDALFLAGPLGDARTSYDAFEGKKGIQLLALSTADGKRQAAHDIGALPVFDGMAAAGGKLFLALQDGSVLCMGR